MKSVCLRSRNSVSGARPQFLGQFATVCHHWARPDAERHKTSNQQPINNNRHQVDSVSIRLLSGLVTLCPSCKTARSLGFLGNSHHPRVGGSMAGYVIHMPSFCRPFVSPLSVFSHAAQAGILAGILPPFRALPAQAGGAGPDDRSDDEIGYARKFPRFS